MTYPIHQVSPRLQKYAKLLSEVFIGRPDGYGTHTPGADDTDVILKQPVTESVWIRHVTGEAPLGIFPITSDGERFTTRWGSIDVDRPDNPEAARAICQRIHDAHPKLKLFWERSKGKGFHGWVFFNEPVPVKSVRHMLKALLKAAKIEEFRNDLGEVKVYPKQDQLTGGGWGNYMYLPLCGAYAPDKKTVFVNPDKNWEPYEDQHEVLVYARDTSLPAWWATEGPPGDSILQMPGTQRPPPKVPPPMDDAVRADAGSMAALTDEELSQLRRLDSVRKAMDHPEKLGYDQWLAMLIHLVPFANGSEIAHEISKGDPSRYDEAATTEKWREAVKIYSRPDRAGAVSISQAIIDHIRGGGSAEITPISAKFCVYKNRLSQRLWTMKDDKLVELTPRAMTNFSAAIIAKELSTDGIGEETFTRLRGSLASGRPMLEIRVPNEVWCDAHRWIPKQWGTDATVVIPPKERYLLLECLQTTGLDAPTVKTYTHTGWTQIGDKWGFLNAGGVAGTGDNECEVGASQVILPPNLMRYNIPSTCPEAKAIRAYQHLENFFHAADLSASAPLIAALFLAPLRTLLNLDLCIFLVGKTSTRKSSLIAAALCFYGKGFTRNSLPESFQSTANSVERTAFMAKDLPLAVDNFVPTLMQNGGQQILSRIAHSVGDGAGRGRLTKGGMGQAYSKPPRALLLLTGEEGAYGESTAARYYTVNMTENTVVNSVLAQIQAAAAADETRWLSAYYLTWLAPQLEDPTFTETILATYQRELALLRGGSGHGRLPEQEAWVRVGLALAEQSHPEGGWVENSLAAKASVCLERVRAERSEAHRETSLSYKTLVGIMALITRGRAHATDPLTGMAPAVHAPYFGWNGLGGKIFPYSAGCMWVDHRMKPGTWIFAVNAEVVTQLLNEDLAKDSVPGRPAALGNALSSDGLLHVLEKGRTTARLTVGEKRERCWFIDGPKMMRLLGLDDEPIPADPIVRVDNKEEGEPF